MAENFSAKPYFDDFSNKKGFHKILFKPGFSVQARELNQMQEILQQQVSRLGTHLFKNGSMVVPGQSKLNSNTSYVILNNDGADSELKSKLLEQKIVQDIDGKSLSATVVHVEDLQDKILAVVQYQNSATKTVSGEVVNVTAFSHEYGIVVEGISSIQISVVEKGPNDEPATGPAIFLVIQEGVFFIDGYFVHTEKQSSLIAWNNIKDISVKTGFHVKKTIVDAYDDPSLFDNATGSPNEAAPGADRFSIILELKTIPLDDEDSDFVELVRHEKGYLRVAKLDTQYATLEETLARRTYDESGDYTVHGLDIRVTDHLKDSRNVAGFKTKEEGGDDNLMAVEVTAGKAYVKGYELENLSSLYLEVDKARSKDSVKVTNNVIQANDNGEYIYLAPGNQFVDISKHPVLWLTTGQENTSDIMGYCIPKYLEAINISGQTIFKLFGTFQLSQSSTYGWQHLGGWKLDELKNGPVLQKLTMERVVSNFNVADGLPLTSHQGWTPYAWDSANRQLFVKKAKTAAVFNKEVQVQKSPASGYVTKIDQKESFEEGSGDLVRLSIDNVKTTKDALGNFELTTDMGWTGIIRTNANGYGVYEHLGSGIFTGRPVAAHTGQDNAYFSNIVNIENEGKRLVINNVAYPNAVFAISAKLNKPVIVRQKTKAEGFTLIRKPSNRAMVLAHKDVFKIKAIYVSKDLNTEPKDSDTDVGSYFDLVNNDTLDFYQNTLLKAKSGFAIPQGQMKVVYEYFLHSPGECFTVDSYESLKDNPVDEDDVTHIGRIPNFSTKEKTYLLSDYLDFRQATREGFFLIKGQTTEGSNQILVEHDYTNVMVPNQKIVGNGFQDGTLVDSVETDKIIASNNSTYTGTIYFVVNVNSATIAQEPFETAKATWSSVAGESIIYDASYFVDRWDRIVYYKNGEIRYVYGVPGIGRYPEVPVDAMSLATLIVPAYTRQASFVKYKKDDNKRYTMRDIGKLERRIENLEYYTTLSLKELETKDMKITDADGFDRFKSGFFVSDFNDFGVFSPFDGGFQATLVPEQQMVTPKEYSDAIRLNFNKTSSTNYVVKDDSVFLPYNHVVQIQQPYGTKTESINPYLIISWNPAMNLTPSSDVWMETEWSPSVTNITNLSNTIQTENVVNQERIDVVESSRTVSGFFGWSTPAPQVRETRQDLGTVTTGLSVQTSQVTNRTENRSNRLLGSSVIPYMRSKTIRFVVKGAKPETRYWAAFDAVDVNRFCRPVINGRVGQWGAPIVSDAMGNIIGEFQIPPGTFSTGSKTLSLADADVLKNPDVGTNCEASATYTAQGTLRTMQEVVDITNTTTTHINVTRVQTKVTLVQRETTNFRRRWQGSVGPDANPSRPQNPLGLETAWSDRPWSRDPLAQSFFTKDVQGPGMFVTKVGIYFAKKDPSLPVYLELREMRNGYPVNERIPGSFVSLSPDQVKVSADSTVETQFEFDKPVWLEGNKEYCVVVLGDTHRYHVWISKIGEKVVNENRIVSVQPSLGTLFKSQNASTWTPYQLEDLKFKLYRAKFDTSVSGDWNFENDGNAAKRRAFFSNMRTTSGSRFVTVKHENHGFQVNDIVKMTKETAVDKENFSAPESVIFNGIPVSDLYMNHIVKAIIDQNHYTIEVATPATKTGYFEDVGRYAYVEGNINYYAMRLVANQYVPADSDIRYYANLITGKDFDGGQTPKVKLSEFQIKNNDANILQEVGLVQTDVNETSKSLVIRSAVQTGNDFVSPVMKLDENHVIVASLALNKPENDNENSINEGKISSKIITKVIRLKTVSDSLRIFTSENKQASDDIEVYYRTSRNRDIENMTWEKLEPINSANSFDNETFIEHERRADGIAEFNEFQIKVVLKGTNSVRRPALKELRAIAVAG